MDRFCILLIMYIMYIVDLIGFYENHGPLTSIFFNGKLILATIQIDLWNLVRCRPAHKLGEQVFSVSQLRKLNKEISM